MADISQRVIFTVIPNGVSGGRARLNLHIAPRLSLVAGVQPADLSQFPAWRDWARTINGAGLTLRINQQTVRPDRMAAADPQIWAALFPQTTPVQTHEFEDLRDHDVLSYPLADLARAIETDYVNLAGTAGDDLPRVAELEKQIRYAPGRQHDRRSLIERLRTTTSAEAVRNRDVAIALLAEYHRPLNQEEVFTAKKSGPDDPHEDADYRAHKRQPMPTPAELTAQFDFHRIVSAIGQHPVLMVACGLVVPLEIDLDLVPLGDVDVQIEVDWAHAGTATEPDVLPVTHARRDAADFRARPKNPANLTGAWLRMDPGVFNLVAMDVDGAGLGLKNFSINLPGMTDERFDDEAFNTDKVARAGAPRLRTAGIQLAQTRRDQAIRGLFTGSYGLNASVVSTGKVALFAEDLIRGWRADIHDDRTGRWQSLLRFDGRYELLHSGQALDSADEEATLRLAVGKAVDGSAPKLLKASEALFAWSGWSLAAPQPGLAIMPDDISHEVAPNETPDGLPLRVTPTTTRGSLPLLRFGRSYRVRMRYADIAGGGLGWTPDDAGPAASVSAPYRFGRYEPVESPVITLIDGDPLPKDGESMARATLRTMDVVADNDIEARRNIVPPRVGIRFVELHGALDRGGRPDPSVYGLLKSRDANYPKVTVDTPAFRPEGAAAAVVETTFATGPEAAATPYLYDPLAGGAALRIAGVPGVNPAKIWRVPFVGDSWDPDAATKWPDALGFSLTASETGVTGWDPASRTFRVVLAPGERARIRMSALIPSRGLAILKLLDRLRELAEASPGAEAAMRYQNALNRARAGQHWMFTPWRTVDLVHAVQRPLITPQFLSLFAGRGAGEIKASIGYATPIHCKSTTRIDMEARWLEIDDHGPDGPITGTQNAQAFRRNFARLDHPDLAAKRLFDEHVFTDTRARWINYAMTATTRFREFMPAPVRNDASLLTRKSPEAGVWVPSSSAPPAPVVSYVVPTFGWSGGGEPGQEQRSWRQGGGIRVYLDRPWFASGSNEMLAVLLPAGTEDPTLSAAKDFVTQWGADPIWAGPKVKTIAPARGAFPKRLDKGPVPYDFGGEGPTDPGAVAEGAVAGDGFPLENLTPQGAPDGLRVHAVPHAVAYDAERKLWYCDIVVRPGGAYFPFIRLALARYQPHSVSGLELSSVAMAAFQQLAPDRVATITPTVLGGRRVSVYGALPAAGYVRPNAGNITIRLQRLAQGGDPDLDWRDTPQGQRPHIGDPLPFATIARTTSTFNIARGALTEQQRLIAKEGLTLVNAGRFDDLLARPEMLALMLPPLIHEETIQLPAANGDRLRLLIVETEQYSTEAESGLNSPEVRERVVYATAMNV